MITAEIERRVPDLGARRRLPAAVRNVPIGLCLRGLALVGAIAVLAPFNAEAQQSAAPVQRQQQVQDLTPAEVAKGISDGRFLLVDVREPDEVAAEAFPNAFNLPLSRFNPRLIQVSLDRQVVFACHTGRRSTIASLTGQAAGLVYDKHLAGGIDAWKAAELPTKRGL
jgi:rhodanese-related sulfurtransferase